MTSTQRLLTQNLRHTMQYLRQSYLYIFMLFHNVSADMETLPTVSLAYQTYRATSLNVCYAV